MPSLHEPGEPLPAAVELFARFRARVLQWGFDAIAYADFKRHADPVAQAAQSGLSPVTYSPGWTQYYDAEKYQEHDVLFRLASCNARPIDWDDCVTVAKTRRQKRVYSDARDARHFFGVSVPFHEPTGFAGMMSLCTSGNRADTLRSPPHIAAICHEFHEIYQYLQPVAQIVEPPHITKQEREILTWIARGKSSAIIGEVMNLSKRSVDTYIQRVCHKLNVSGRIQCVLVASRFGLIQPLREI